jgi:hypothetical protein
LLKRFNLVPRWGSAAAQAYLEGKEEEGPNDTEGHMGRKALRPFRLKELCLSNLEPRHFWQRYEDYIRTADMDHEHP